MDKKDKELNRLKQKYPDKIPVIVNKYDKSTLDGLTKINILFPKI